MLSVSVLTFNAETLKIYEAVTLFLFVFPVKYWEKKNNVSLTY